MKSNENYNTLREQRVENDSTSNFAQKKSGQKWALDIVEITLHPSFGSFYNQFFSKHENIHFISFSWDASNFSSNLNFIGNVMPMELFPGQSHEFGEIGLSLFPENKVVNSLNVSFLIFKTKKRDHGLLSGLDEIEAIIESSLLAQELAEINDEFSQENIEYLSFLEGMLVDKIQEKIKNSNHKLITSFRFNFPTQNELEFYGSECYLQDGVRICLKKSKK